MPAAVLIVEQVLKPIVDRRYVWGYGELYYPSGTVTGVAAWTTLVWLLACRCSSSAAVGSRSGWCSAGSRSLAAASVVGADRHFPFDAIGGLRPARASCSRAAPSSIA